MSTLSKVLAVLNLLALFAYTFLGINVYSARNAWQYKVFRVDLAQNGLPLNQDVVDENGMPVAERISEETLKDIFSSIGGKPGGPTLVDEAKAVRQRVEAKINEAGDAKGRVLAEFLIPLTNNLVEREELLSALAKPSDAALNTKLEERVKNLLAAATEGSGTLDTGNKTKMAIEQQREAIARLVWAAQNMDSESAAGQGISRLVALVGPALAINTVVQSTRNIEELTKQVDKARSDEQANFLERHGLLVSDLRAKDLKKQQLELEKQKMEALAEDQGNAKAQRRRDREKLADELAQARAESNELMTQLRSQGIELYNKRVQVLEAIRLMQEKEKEIRQLEGLKP